MGLGGAEIVIILLVLVLLFGPTLIAFWLGFTLGKKRAASPAEKPAASEAPAAPAPTTPSPEPEPVNTPDEEPTDV